MAVRWTIPFRTINNNLLTVRIYDSSWSGSSTTLVGAVAPFVTDNGSDEDFMSPVRISTGNIKIVNTGSRGESSIFPTAPKARFVELTNSSGTVIWQGYIKQQQYTQPWDVTPYELTFPVVSPLGILDGIKIEKGSVADRARVAEYLRQAINNTGGTYNTIIYPSEIGETSSSTMNALFRLGIQDRTWFEYKNENVFNKSESRYEGVSWLSLLESLMESFGYTLYEQGLTLYIVSRTASSYASISVSGLSTLANNSTPTTTTHTRTTHTVSNLQIADNNADQTVTQPASRVTVEGEIKPFEDDSTPQIDSKYLDYVDMLDIKKARNSTSDDGYYFDKRVAVYEPVSGQAVWRFRQYGDGALTTWSSQDITRDYYMGLFCREMSGENVIIITRNDLEGKHGYGGAWSTTWVVAVKGATQNLFAGGNLVLRGKVESYEGTGGGPTRQAVFAMRVGSYYYNASTHGWTTTFTTFRATITDSGAIGPVSYVEHGDEDGYYMQLPDNGIYGDVELYILCPLTTSAADPQLEAVYLFRDLEVNFVGPAQDIFKDYPVTDTNRFAENIRTFGTDEIAKNIPLTSYINNRIGHGVLLYPDFSKPLGKVYISGYGTDYFERNIIRACNTLYYSPQHVLNIPFQRAASFTPTDQFYYSGTYRYLSAKVEWREEKQTVKMYKSL